VLAVNGWSRSQFLQRPELLIAGSVEHHVPGQGAEIVVIVEHQVFDDEHEEDVEDHDERPRPAPFQEELVGQCLEIAEEMNAADTLSVSGSVLAADELRGAVPRVAL